MMEFSSLLEPVSADAPSGEPLEYDASFLALERAAQGQPERQMGDSVLAAEAPNWRDVREQSSQLLKSSKDLRISYYWLCSQIALDGLNGFAQGLHLSQALLAQYWDTLYPELDADDDNDPTIRINALASLSSEAVVNLLRDCDLIRTRAFGPIKVRAALNAAGLLSFNSEVLTSEQLSAAFRDCDEEQLTQLRSTLSSCQTCIQHIQQLVAEQVGSHRGVDLSPLSQTLKQLHLVLADHAPQTQRAETALDSAPAEAGVAQPSTGPARLSGEVRNRDDVLSALDRIIEYYQRHEPSSPLPVLLQRARGLVEADFASIVRNLIPDGVSQFENLRGPEAY